MNPSRGKNPPSSGPVNDIPLAVALDGTLIKTDLLIESLLILVKRNPLYIFLVFFWLSRGRAHLKHQVGTRVTLDVSSLPYHVELLILLRDFKEKGRRLILATDAEEKIARQIAGYLQIFDTTIASDGGNDLSCARKRDRLVAMYGRKGFDYAGTGRKDLVIWAAARKALVVNADLALSGAVADVTDVEKVLPRQAKGRRPYLRALRLYQWLKNVLVFVPMVAAHRLNEPVVLGRACLAFLAFGLCASSVYVLNDLLDLSEDRRHPRKRRRPFASGDVPLAIGLLMTPLLLGLSLALSLLLPVAFFMVLTVYYSLTLMYSFRLKRIMMLDVIILAGLFTVRMMAGSAAVDIWPSHWLLAFSMFLFVSLALLKRYAELVVVRKAHGRNATARGYAVRDRELLAAMGSASGFISVLVLALYITSGAATAYYGHDRVIWLACPLLFYWISYIWLIAHRGAMHDDPLVFALKDRNSWVVLIFFTIIMLIAT